MLIEPECLTSKNRLISFPSSQGDRWRWILPDWSRLPDSTHLSSGGSRHGRPRTEWFTGTVRIDPLFDEGPTVSTTGGPNGGRGSSDRSGVCDRRRKP